MHIGKKEEQIGRSFLSPENEFNKQAGKVVNKDNYISPGSKEYADYINKLDEEYEEDTSEAVSSNRIQAYIILAVVLYFLALGVGYHYTTFEDDVPQVTTAQKIEANEYLSQTSRIFPRTPVSLPVPRLRPVAVVKVAVVNVVAVVAAVVTAGTVASAATATTVANPPSIDASLTRTILEGTPPCGGVFFCFRTSASPGERKLVRRGGLSEACRQIAAQRLPSLRFF